MNKVIIFLMIAIASTATDPIDNHFKAINDSLKSTLQNAFQDGVLQWLPLQDQNLRKLSPETFIDTYSHDLMNGLRPIVKEALHKSSIDDETSQKSEQVMRRIVEQYGSTLVEMWFLQHPEYNSHIRLSRKTEKRDISPKSRTTVNMIKAFGLLLLICTIVGAGTVARMTDPNPSMFRYYDF
jgi:hypothetical protein